MPVVDLTEISPFDKMVGVSYESVSGDRADLSFNIAPHLLQTYGIVHGGVWCTIVETAASVGAATWWGERGDLVGVANHTNFLRAAREGRVTAVATPIHRGRTQQLWSVEIRDADERVLAQGQVRFQHLESAAVIGNS